MKSVMVVQRTLPHYRSFIWEGLEKKYKLYLIDLSKNTITLPSGKAVLLNDFKLNFSLDVMIIDGGLRAFYLYIKYKFLFKPLKIIAISHFLGVKKFFVYRIIREIYLTLLFDKILLYYDHEMKQISLNCLRKKCIGFNNTVDTGPIAIEETTKYELVRFLFIGRYSKKSLLEPLLRFASSNEDFILDIIGLEKHEVNAKFHAQNIQFFGHLNDPILISKISTKCQFFVYPGDVGLSVIHALKMGLVPILHNNDKFHMPEGVVALQNFPCFQFSRKNWTSFEILLDTLTKVRIGINLKKQIYRQANEQFSKSICIDNFILAIDGA